MTTESTSTTTGSRSERHASRAPIAALPSGRRRAWGRAASAVAIAAVLPFLTVFGAFKIAGAIWKPPPTLADTPVRHSSDYAARPQKLAPRLGAATVVWRDPDHNTSGINADTGILFLDGRLLIAGMGTLIAVDPGGAELGRVTLRDDERGRFRAAWDVTAGLNRNDVWIYHTLTGAFGRFDLERAAGPLDVVTLDEPVVQALWYDGRIIANGFFAEELLRVYTPPPRATETAREARPAAQSSPRASATAPLLGAYGDPLFPQLITPISRQLSNNRVALSAKVGKLVLAFRWSNRLNVYDARTMRLERSIAGPHETKIDFAVGRTPDGWPAFSLSDESTFCYLDVAATEQGIVALYSGRERRKFRGATALGDELHVVGWDGRPIAIWRLPEALYRIALDESRRVVYGLRSPKREVVRIDAPDLFGRPAAAAKAAGSTH